MPNHQPISKTGPSAGTAESIVPTHFTPAELLTLISDFSHDVRTPLTVIGEFSAMMQEGVLSTDPEREEATSTICSKAVEVLLLVDVLEMLVRARCDAISVRRDACDGASVLRTAASQLEQFSWFAANSQPGASAPAVIRCDPSLAALTLVQMAMWMRRVSERGAVIALEARFLPDVNGTVLLAARHGSRIAADQLARRKSPLTAQSREAESGQQHLDLTLRIACELGQLAGGDVFIIGNMEAAALLVPSADSSQETKELGAM